MKRGPNESIQIVIFRIEHCKTAARTRFPRGAGINSRKNGTFSKKRAKPQREAKTQRATTNESSPREGVAGRGRRRGLRDEVSGARSRGRGFGGEVSRRRAGRGFRGEVLEARSRGRGEARRATTNERWQFFKLCKNPIFATLHIWGTKTRRTIAEFLASRTVPL